MNIKKGKKVIKVWRRSILSKTPICELITDSVTEAVEKKLKLQKENSENLIYITGRYVHNSI